MNTGVSAAHGGWWPGWARAGLPCASSSLTSLFFQQRPPRAEGGTALVTGRRGLGWASEGAGKQAGWREGRHQDVLEAWAPRWGLGDEEELFREGKERTCRWNEGQGQRPQDSGRSAGPRASVLLGEEPGV